jgi:hypothetical protein
VPQELRRDLEKSTNGSFPAVKLASCHAGWQAALLVCLLVGLQA